jgi:hypothetical protein
MEKDRKDAWDVGSESPASERAKQQRMSGTSGGPQAGREAPRTEKQPPQTSGRRDPAHEHKGSVRKGYEAAEDPEQQGDGDPGPDRIRKASSQQGHGGAGGGTGGGSTAGERAQAGEPKGAHTRSGRQRTPGDRDPQQPE